jgi:D-amino-acid dehydrogenase
MVFLLVFVHLALAAVITQVVTCDISRGQNEPMASYDVAVVGGGLVGTATAYELGRRGVRTLLVDRADAGRATDAGAGILSPETTKRDDPDWVALVHAAGEHYEQLVPQLAGDTGWARCGILQLATRPSDVPAWEWVAARATGAAEISPEDARTMVPVLGDVVRALHHPAAARVDGRLMCAALRRAAVNEHGVEVREESVDDVRALPADSVVIAGGAWTDAVSRQLGVRLPIGPVRGQIIHLGVDAHDTGGWPIVQPVFGYYMVPWADARVAVGATVEDVGFATDVTAGGVYEVLRETLRVMPGLAGTTLREVRVGLRPVSADDSPILGPLPGVPPGGPKMFVATGHGANGLLLGPVSGAIVADLVCGGTPVLDPAPFGAQRFESAK